MPTKTLTKVPMTTNTHGRLKKLADKYGMSPSTLLERIVNREADMNCVPMVVQEARV